MKSKWFVVGLFTLGLMVFCLGCGGSSSGSDNVNLVSNLSAKQGPNKSVIEPEDLIMTTPTGNFFNYTEDAADTKAGSVLKMFVDATRWDAGIGWWPQKLTLDAIVLGILMGDIAADASIAPEDACDQLVTDLNASIVGKGGTPDCFDLTNCTITSEQKGSATVDFDASTSCQFAFTHDHNVGKLTVRGKMLDAAYPRFVPEGGTDMCGLGSRCKDVKIAAVSDDFGDLVDDVLFTAKGVFSAYVFNFDLETNPSLYDLPIFIVANVQINDEDLSFGFSMPDGIDNLTNSIGNVMDTEGTIFGFEWVDADTITLYTMPLLPGGEFCASVFDKPGANWVRNDPASDDCGLCDSLTINPTTGAATCP